MNNKKVFMRKNDGVDPGATSPPSITERQQNKDNNTQQEKHNFLFLPEHSIFNNTNNVTPQDAQSLIAKQMNSLTVNERQKAYEDLHAVPQLIQETPDFVAEKIEQLQLELIKIKNKQAYEKALKQGPKYVDTKRFKVMFLRATHFDAREAAHQIVCHFEEKLCWFDESALGRPIVMADMGYEEMKLVHSGFYQILPARDRAGRRILWSNPLGDIKVNVKSLARALWYIIMVLSEIDEESQIRGHVGVFYSTTKCELSHADRSNAYVVSRLVPVVPNRPGGLHCCLRDSKMAGFISLFNFALGHHINCRFRVHQGSDTELQYKLMTFGINYEILPLTNSGEVKLKYHNEWIQRQRLREVKFPFLLYEKDNYDNDNQQTTNKQNKIQDQSYTFSSNGNCSLTIVDLPGIYDVMLGRGRPCQVHSGNITLMELIESVRDELDNAPRGEKQKIQQEKILKKIHSLGGRFLEQQKTEGWWIEVSNKVALDKIAHTYRNSDPKRRKKHGQQQ